MKEITITDCPDGKDMIITIDEEQQEKFDTLLNIVLKYNNISREDYAKNPGLYMKMKYPTKEEFYTINALYKAAMGSLIPKENK